MAKVLAGQARYAVALGNSGDVWIEFYWADDAGHAREQAEDANASAEVLCIASATC